jgi:release factor glutamine methyltransferase
MTLQEFISLVVERLSVHYPVQEAKAIAVRLLKESIDGYKGYEHLVEPGRELEGFAAGTEEYLLKCAQRLATGEPLQYVLGYEWFCGHRFNVAPGVLIPRPETEELVREVVAHAMEAAKNIAAGEVAQSEKGVPGVNGAVASQETIGKIKVLDICTGSGCIAWSVAAELGERAQVYGCYISTVALGIARGQQLEGNGTGVKFFECDILAPQAEEVICRECMAEGRIQDGQPAGAGPFCPADQSGAAGKFDIIVSNPPYVCECEKALMQKNVLDFEPELALFVPDDDPLRFYRRIAQLSGRLLKPGGKLFFEINERFGRETVEMLEETGFVGCRVLQDIFGKERMVVACR